MAQGKLHIDILQPAIPSLQKSKPMPPLYVEISPLLTPHLTGAIAGRDQPIEQTILQAGAYNLGFLYPAAPQTQSPSHCCRVNTETASAAETLPTCSTAEQQSRRLI